jgi:hydroxymethylbilane synthase
MTTRGSPLRLGTRGSDLALRQAATVQRALEDRRNEVDLVEVETRGDQITDELIHRLGKTGAFVRALDEQVLDGDLDLAVHSMKDVPTEMPDDLVVAGVPERAAARDVLVTPDGRDLDDLTEGATVGTSSLRRRALLLSERPDLEVEPLRGNVDTRIEKLLAPALQREHERRIDAAEDGEADDGDGESDDGDGPDFDRTVEEWFDGLSEVERRALERDVEEPFDAIVLAESGLERAGLLHHVPHQRLRPEEFVPAPAQGALAVTALDDDLADDVMDVLDHPPSRVETTVERTVLAELGGGCVAPVGVYAVLQGEIVRATVRVLDRDGEEEVREARELPVSRHRQAAREFAADLAEAGAADLVAQARREDPDEAKRVTTDGTPAGDPAGE